MAELDPSKRDPWKQITTDINDLHDHFIKTQKLSLTDDKCLRVQTYFKKGYAEAAKLQKEVRILGIASCVSLSGAAVTAYFSKNKQALHKFSTVLLIVGIVSIFWFFKRYIDKKDLQVDFFDNVPHSSHKDQDKIDEDLRNVADVMIQGCDPSISLAESSGDTCSMLSACMAKHSLRTAILVAMMYKNKKLLKQHATDSLVYIRDKERAGMLLEQFGAHPKAKDTHLIKSAAERLNAVAIKELITRGVRKEGLEEAVNAARARRESIKPILLAYGASDYASHTTSTSLASYLKSVGVAVSQKCAKKTLELLKA